MNILYIFGNGFDKAQGMATNYSEFYEYLSKNIDENNELLNQLKEDINGDEELWSNMEKAFGLFTSKIKDTTDLEILYYELSKKLQEYLTLQDEEFIPTEKLKSKFVNALLYPLNHLRNLDKLRFEKFTKSFSSDRYIHIMTFNYTNTIEKLLSLNDATSKNFGNSKYLQDIVHIHGRLGQTIIIGVDNEEQIANNDFRLNDDAKDLLIKQQSNQVMKETRHLTCESYIANAHIIILFGVSLGETDNRWWKLIGEQFRKRQNLIIIQHIYNSDFQEPTQLQKIGKMERTERKRILEKMDITSEKYNSSLMDDRLFFTINSNVF